MKKFSIILFGFMGLLHLGLGMNKEVSDASFNQKIEFKIKVSQVE